jgi:Ca2+-binding RTX toxin-like protein
MRPMIAVFSVTAGLALSTGVAAASTVQVENGVAVFRSGNLSSDLVARDEASSSTRFADSLQALGAGAGCASGATVLCAAVEQDIRFGSGDDTYRGFSHFPIEISAAGGDDSIRTSGNVNTVTAGPGDDTVWENGNTKGLVNGNDGDDRLNSFGSDGDLRGGNGDDLLALGFSGFRNNLAGGSGDDEIVATIFGGGTATGGTGDDVIVFAGNLKAWTVDAGSDDDVIVGGNGADSIVAGSGDDIVDAADDNVDTINCGSGWDVVYADPDDSVSRSCEVRRPGPMPASGAVDAARAHADALIAATPEIPGFPAT